MTNSEILIPLICTAFYIILHFVIFGVTTWALTRIGKKYVDSAGDTLYMVFWMLLPVIGDFIGICILGDIISITTEDI